MLFYGILQNPNKIRGIAPVQEPLSHLGLHIAHRIASTEKVFAIKANVILFPILSIIAPKKGEINEVIKKAVGVHIAALLSEYPYLSTMNS